MTNYEKIKQMSVEEMAEHILNEFCIECEDCEYRTDYHECVLCIQSYLKSEVGELTPQEAIKILKVEYLGDSENMELAKHIAIEALEKQMPKKVIETDWIYCPNCKRPLDVIQKYKYCVICGQKLDWSEKE